jgi:transcriptional regulator with XRE-family HTH domain
MNITAYRLRTLRESMGLSQREVAERIGMTRAAYNKYERGTSRPVRKLNELTALFGVTTDYLLGKDATTFENQLTDLAAHDYDQIQKYLGLSQENKLLADIMLDALHDREQKSGTENPTIKKAGQLPSR